MAMGRVLNKPYKITHSKQTSRLFASEKSACLLCKFSILHIISSPYHLSPNNGKLPHPFACLESIPLSI